MFDKKAQRIVDVIHDVVAMDDVQPGFPDAHGNTNVTWCNRALNRMLTMLNGNASLILEPRGINWTNANAMVRNARGNCEKVPNGETAQMRANEGQLVIAVAENQAGPGHVALVCPDVNMYLSEMGPRIGQAGLRNGIMYLINGFGARLYTLVEYYLIPEEKGCGA